MLSTRLRHFTITTKEILMDWNAKFCYFREKKATTFYFICLFVFVLAATIGTELGTEVLSTSPYMTEGKSHKTLSRIQILQVS